MNVSGHLEYQKPMILQHEAIKFETIVSCGCVVEVEGQKFCVEGDSWTPF